MPKRKRRSLSFAFLIGGLLLGVAPASEAHLRRHYPNTDLVGIVRFRHDVYLREGRALHHATAYAPRVHRAAPRPAPAAPAPVALFLDSGSRAERPGELWVQPTSFTPYDPYMGTVRAVINHLEPHPATMSLACQLMQEGRRFAYVMGDPYTANPPTVTAMEQAGDCKAKALWLYRGLGDADALFVVGKATRHSRTSHAWVYWHNENRWWILDCTNRSEPIAAESVSSDRYIPYYSYGRTGSFRHKATCLLVNPTASSSGTPAVADHSSPQGSR